MMAGVAKHGAPQAKAFVMCQLGPFEIFPEEKERLNDMDLVELKYWALPGQRVVSYSELSNIAEREQFKLDFFWKV